MVTTVSSVLVKSGRSSSPRVVGEEGGVGGCEIGAGVLQCILWAFTQCSGARKQEGG